MNYLLRLVLPLCVCSGCVMFVVSGCNKEELDVDVAFIQGGASRTFSTPITEIDFGYDGDGILVTSNRKKVYETIDYGVTWTVCTTFTGSSAFVDQVRFTNTGTLPYIVFHPTSGGNAQMFVNVSGGTTWLNQIISSGNTICHSFYNSSSGYAYIKLPTYNYCFAQTTDFGDSYSYVTNGPPIGPFMQFTSATRGYAMTNQTQFSFTNDGGLTWTASYSNCQFCTKVTPNGICFLVGADEKIRKSTDFGETWTVCFDDPGGNYYSAIACSDDGLVVVAAEGHLLCSRDAGLTWKYLKLGSSSTMLTRVLILGDGSVIGTTANTVSKYIIPAVL